VCLCAFYVCDKHTLAQTNTHIYITLDAVRCSSTREVLLSRAKNPIDRVLCLGKQNCSKISPDIVDHCENKRTSGETRHELGWSGGNVL